MFSNENALGDGAAHWLGGVEEATGRLPLSMITSAPERTRATSEAKSLAASASEMWITSPDYTPSSAASFDRGSRFLLCFRPSSLCCFSRNLAPLLGSEGFRPYLRSLFPTFFAALAAHLLHDF